MNEEILKLYEKRQKWVESTKDNNFDAGINNLLTELYPDNAHFIYELLQNAEDAQATEVSFILNENQLKFIHNGKDFDYKDLEGITSIGQGTKANDINKIGKFGVGFKAVFSYTKTPKIYSGKYSFEIKDLVVPSPIDSIYINNKTIMIFPFNSKKSKKLAYEEIKKGLEELDDITLLFLNNIYKVEYYFDGKKSSIERKNIDDIKIEISNSSTSKISKWLRFKKNINNSSQLFVSIAFKLTKDQKSNKEIIEPVNGRVSIYFPAEKETSNLKFHLHAPFSSTVARDSIKNIKDNENLRDLLAKLLCESLEYIKKSKLLDFNFLRCLPNEDDNLSNFYKPLQEKIVEIFNNESYVLTDNNNYKPAIYCYHGNSELKKILNISFLKKLLQTDDDIFWVKNAFKNSREDKFLNLLEINDFTSKDFTDLLEDLFCNFDEIEDFPEYQDIYNEFKNKPDKWFGNLYSFLYKENERGNIFFYDRKIIKLSNNELNINDDNCYFSDVKNSKFLIVKKETYNSNTDSINKNAKLFLEEYLYVKEIGEKEKIQLLLETNYTQSKRIEDIGKHLKDMESFLKYFEKYQDISLFKNYYILLDKNNILRKGSDLIIDKPYIDTGMYLLYKEEYFNKKYYLSKVYYSNLKEKESFKKIIRMLDLIFQLKFESRTISYKNQYYHELKKDLSKTNEIWKTCINQDWIIKDIKDLLNYQDINISLIIWNTMINAKKEQLIAKYRPNASYPIRTADSLLVQCLKDNSWIPDKDGNFNTPQDISQEMLPKEFIFDNRNGWLDAINFAENIRKKEKKYKETNKIIKEQTGFDLDILEELKKVGITKDDLKNLTRQKLQESLQKNQGSGDTKEFISDSNNESIIINDSLHQKNIGKENRSNQNKFIDRTKNYKSQNSNYINEIKQFLYKEYAGHCQICGDTFAYNDKNTFKIKSLNIGKNRDINRKGNSLSLCCKHHEIIDKNLHKNKFIEELESSIDLDFIDKKFIFEDFVSKGDINDTNDSFYRLNKNDDFTRDVYFLPIKIFNKIEYIKFTKAHIMEFIEVWNED